MSRNSIDITYSTIGRNDYRSGTGRHPATASSRRNVSEFRSCSLTSAFVRPDRRREYHGVLKNSSDHEDVMGQIGTIHSVRKEFEALR